MADVVRNWRVELVTAYPDIFHPPAGAPEAAQGSPECGEGWRDLLERACARIRAAVQADGGSFKATQIKEKYASLRFYWDGSLSEEVNGKVEEAIDLAEARSACTCEECGEEGRLYQAGGVLLTRCTTHAKGNPVPEKPGWENITITRVDTRGSKSVVVKRRRYVRETDSFVEADPLIIGDGE
jgi:hypothetical protein